MENNDSPLSVIDRIEVISLPKDNDLEAEFINAKLFLQKCSAISGDSLYDHLCEIINKTLLERNENVIDYFEEFSRKVKEFRYQSMTDDYQHEYSIPMAYYYGLKIMPLIRSLNNSPANIQSINMNMKFMFHCFHEIGLQIDKTELFGTFIKMKKLTLDESIKNLRFWGKIFGRFKNYLIVEAELTDGAYENRRITVHSEFENEEMADSEDDTFVINEEDPGSVEINLTRNRSLKIGSSESIPKEESGEGLNKKVYYVCNDTTDDEWVQLPDVQPHHIVVARKILYYFTGDLRSKVESYPRFPGVEKHYLRAQIARISSSTQISPKRFYKVASEIEGDNVEVEDEDEGNSETEEDESYEEYHQTEGHSNGDIKCNKNYEKKSIEELSDTRLTQWVHHAPYIFENGRSTTYFNPDFAEDEFDYSSDECENDNDYMRKMSNFENGPKLFTSISKDFSNETLAPWIVQVKARYLLHESIAVVRSNLWPGAKTYATEECFENMYIGWGMKRYASFVPETMKNRADSYIETKPSIYEYNITLDTLDDSVERLQIAETSEKNTEIEETESGQKESTDSDEEELTPELQESLQNVESGVAKDDLNSFENDNE